MDFDEETKKSVQGRLGILRKGIVSEENSVNYYKTLLDKNPEDSEENIGILRKTRIIHYKQKVICIF